MEHTPLWLVVSIRKKLRLESTLRENEPPWCFFFRALVVSLELSPSLHIDSNHHLYISSSESLIMKFMLDFGSPNFP